MKMTAPFAAPARLLIVEDDVRLCRLVKDYLETMGYSVAMEYSGPAGLAAALKDSFQAIILDVMLPGMDGFEVRRGGGQDRRAGARRGRLSP
jgi:two-component system response regulator CpxR